MAIDKKFTLTHPSIILGQEVEITIYMNDFDLKTPHLYYSVNGTETLIGTAVVGVSNPGRFKWIPPLSLADSFTDTVFVNGFFHIITKTIDANGANSVIDWGTQDFTASIPTSVAPVVSATCSIVNDNETVRSWGVALRNMTKVEYSIQASGSHGSTIESVTFNVGGQNLSGTSGTSDYVRVSGNVIPVASAKDSRGRITHYELPAINFVEYSNPVIEDSYARRCNSDGTLDDTGQYAKLLCRATCSSVDGRNSVTTRERHRTINGTWTQYRNITNGSENFVNLSLLFDRVYEIELSAIDTVGNVTSVIGEYENGKICFSLKSGGDGAAFGRQATVSDWLDVVWNLGVGKDLVVNGSLKLGSKQTNIFDLIYPVGSIYISTNNTNPGQLFGGTWEQIKDRFLLSKGDKTTAGNTGGNSDHQINVNELPSHHHTILGTIESGGSHSHEIGYDVDGGSGSSRYTVHGAGTSGSARTTYTSEDGEHSHTFKDGKTNGTYTDSTFKKTVENKSFSIMPPYLIVYMWKRTA